MSPNPRLQRTRAVRSPLSRKPLGDLARLLARTFPLAVLTLGSFLGCVSVGGRLRVHRGSYMDVEALERLPNDSPPQPSILVVARDLNSGPLPGAQVELIGENGPYPMTFPTDLEGTARPTVGPGEWKVTVTLPGFLSVSRVVTVHVGKRCVLRAYLRLAFPPEAITAVPSGQKVV
jgi:hypothetical protein